MTSLQNQVTWPVHLGHVTPIDQSQPWWHHFLLTPIKVPHLRMRLSSRKVTDQVTCVSCQKESWENSQVPRDFFWEHCFVGSRPGAGQGAQGGGVGDQAVAWESQWELKQEKVLSSKQMNLPVDNYTLRSPGDSGEKAEFLLCNVWSLSVFLCECANVKTNVISVHVTEWMSFWFRVTVLHPDLCVRVK